MLKTQKFKNPCVKVESSKYINYLRLAEPNRDYGITI